MVLCHQGRHFSKRVMWPGELPGLRNPVQGDRGSLTSFNLTGVGSFEPGDRPNRNATRPGKRPFRGPLENPAAAKSSTMKGPRGLAGESCGRRCQIANDLSRWVGGCFYVRSPESEPLARRLCQLGRAGNTTDVPPR